MKNTLYTLVMIVGSLAILGGYTHALFADSNKIENNNIKTNIWNPGIVTITEVAYDPSGADPGNEWIKIGNTGGYPISIKDYVLQFDGVGSNHYVFPDVILLPGNEVVVHLNTTGTNTGTDLFWTNTGGANMNNNSGSVSLFAKLPKNAANIKDFVQYGAAGKNQEANAATAGIWTLGTFVADAPEGNSLVLIDNIDHNSVADWTQRLLPL